MGLMLRLGHSTNGSTVALPIGGLGMPPAETIPARSCGFPYSRRVLTAWMTESRTSVRKMRADLWLNDLEALPFDTGKIRKLRRVVVYRLRRLASAG